jgi:hypothetical protein
MVGATKDNNSWTRSGPTADVAAFAAEAVHGRKVTTA